MVILTKPAEFSCELHTLQATKYTNCKLETKSEILVRKNKHTIAIKQDEQTKTFQQMPGQVELAAHTVSSSMHWPTKYIVPVNEITTVWKLYAQCSTTLQVVDLIPTKVVSNIFFNEPSEKSKFKEM